jgi:hypothetical protein
MATRRTLSEDMKGRRPAMLDLARRPTRVVVARPPKPWNGGRPRKPQRLTKDIQRRLVKCVGVPSLGGRPAIPCAKLIKLGTGQGRPTNRCRECKVLRWWWSSMTRDEPGVVAQTIVKLAKDRRIGIHAVQPKGR